MHKPTHPAVRLTLDGVLYHLRFDFEAIAQAEEITDRPLLTGIRQKDIQTPKISFVCAMFFASLLADQPSITYEDAKALVTRANIVEVWTHVLQSWTQSSVEDVQAPADGNPQKDPS